MGKTDSVGRSARDLVQREYRGVLSTHSVDAPGYPFGSVVPFCLDRSGAPIIFISQIAQHTRNILVNPKVSLIVADRAAEDIQASARLTLLADAHLIFPPDEDIAERYYRYFPSARDYYQTHDFDFFRLQVVRTRYIGGFGEIHWLEAAEVTLANPFGQAEERRIVEHMNEDHTEALRHYCHCAGIALADGEQPQMAGADGEGFHLLVGARLYWLRYPAPVSNLNEARQALVTMAKQPC